MDMTPAQTTNSGSFVRSAGNGTYAALQFAAAIASGRPLSASLLRTCDLLRKDQWKSFDQELVREGTIRLQGVADLIAAGLTKPIVNSLGKTVHQYEKITDLTEAKTTMSGLSQTENEAFDYDLSSIPLPVTHKDWHLDLRKIEASRAFGEPLDTTMSGQAGRLVSEQLENLLFNASGQVYGGLSIYGYTTYPYRNTANFGNTDKSWSDSTKTGENMLDDLFTMIAGLEGDRFYGPYALYVPGNISRRLDVDFKANSTQTIRERLLKVDRLAKIVTVDKLASDNLILVQLTSDVVQWLQGERLQNVQWEILGGFRVNFKAFTIQVPLIKSDAENRCGIFHMS